MKTKKKFYCFRRIEAQGKRSPKKNRKKSSIVSKYLKVHGTPKPSVKMTFLKCTEGMPANDLLC